MGRDHSAQSPSLLTVLVAFALAVACIVVALRATAEAELGAEKAERALDVLIREAWLSSVGAQILLPILQEHSVVGFRRHDSRILAIHRAQAALGWPRGQPYFGRILLHGWGVPEDPARGTELPEAYLALGEYFVQRGGAGRAEGCYRQAAELGVEASPRPALGRFRNPGG